MLHQWYWSYQYGDYISESGESIEFDSYMILRSTKIYDLIVGAGAELAGAGKSKL